MPDQPAWTTKKLIAWSRDASALGASRELRQQDLSDCSLSSIQDLDGVSLNQCKLPDKIADLAVTNWKFQSCSSHEAIRCTFTQCQFLNDTFNVIYYKSKNEIHITSYSRCRFVQCDFRNSNARPMLFQECKLYDTLLRDRHFQDPSDRAIFIQNKFSMVNCDHSGTIMMRFVGYGLQMLYCNGVWGIRPIVIDNSGLKGRGSPDPGYSAAQFAKSRDRLSWSIIGALGKSKLFAISWTTLAFITLYGTIASWYNSQLHDLQERSDALRLPWVSSLEPLSASSEMFWLLFGIFWLVIATTTYISRCPSIVQQYTETEWAIEHKQQLYEYRAASWSRPASRYACAVAYLLATPAFLVFLIRVARTIHLFLI